MMSVQGKLFYSDNRLTVWDKGYCLIDLSSCLTKKTVVPAAARREISGGFFADREYKINSAKNSSNNVKSTIAYCLSVSVSSIFVGVLFDNLVV